MDTNIKSRRHGVTPKITLEALAQASGVSRSYLHHLESRDSANPTVRVMNAIDQAFIRLEAERASTNFQEVKS